LDINDLTLRQLQTESARAISTMAPTNDNIYQFNKQAHHNSHNWYRVVIEWYVNKYGGLPSEIGPGVQVELILDD